MAVARGDIFFASLDPVVGSEQAGARPVVVVQNDVANARIPTITVVPITANPRAGPLEGRPPQDSFQRMFKRKSGWPTRIRFPSAGSGSITSGEDSGETRAPRSHSSTH